MESSLKAEYAQGHLLFLREGALLAQPFDVSRLQFSGDPVPVAERVSAGAVPGFSVSPAGVLAFRTRNEELESRLLWYSRTGQQQESAVGTADGFNDIHLSPDGARAAVSIRDATGNSRDVWILDLERGQRTRFSFRASDEADGIWSPDGSQIAYSDARGGSADIYLKATSGAGAEQLLLADASDKRPVSWSPDGRHILFLRGRGTTFIASSPWDIWVLPLEGERKPRPFIASPFNDTAPQFSPDGRWVAYQSNESGPFEVFVVPFGESGSRWQVSAKGGQLPRWRGDGREIYYTSPEGRLMAATIEAGGDTLRVADVRPLFDLPTQTASKYTYDVTRDGGRFLVAAAGDLKAPMLTVHVNWTQLLTRGD